MISSAQVPSRALLSLDLKGLVLAIFLIFAWPDFAFPGPGHDHGPAAAATGQQMRAPRLVAESESYQLVGILEGEVLVIYLDRTADNSPVTNAKLEIAIGDETLTPELQKSGVYEAVFKTLKNAGDHSAIITIVEGNKTDLLTGAIAIPPPAAKGGDQPHTLLSHFNLSTPGLRQAGIGVGGLLLLLGAALAFKRPGRAAGWSASIAGALLLGISSVYAHEGHDHGAGGVTPSGNAPQRQPDGSIFLPKPTQRLLEVRTRILQVETNARTARFQGRIVANPNRSGVVQSTIQGRFSAPPSGVAAIGMRVNAGDILGYVAPSFVSKEASDIRQALSEIEQQISLTRAKMDRSERLLRSNAVAKVTVDETRIQLEGLLKRRKDLLDAQIRPEELRAPVNGVISSARVISGQVVSPADQIFHIIDPSSLYVEALIFDHANADNFRQAFALLASGVALPLRFIGRSRSLQQQYSVLKFEIERPDEGLNTGTPVIVSVQNGETISGLVVPRAAIAQAPNGQMVVFQHKEAELFLPRAVRFMLFGADMALLTSGVEPGEKIVVQSSALVNQVR